MKKPAEFQIVELWSFWKWINQTFSELKKSASLINFSYQYRFIRVKLLWNVKVQQKGEKSNKKKKHALIACTLMREEKMDQPIAILEIRGGLIIERWAKCKLSKRRGRWPLLMKSHTRNPTIFNMICWVYVTIVSST